MTGMIRKSLDMPEETRMFEAGTGKLELISTGAGPVGRATFQPGWQWSRHVKPIAQTESCQAPQFCTPELMIAERAGTAPNGGSVRPTQVKGRSRSVKSLRRASGPDRRNRTR